MVWLMVQANFERFFFIAVARVLPEARINQRALAEFYVVLCVEPVSWNEPVELTIRAFFLRPVLNL